MPRSIPCGRQLRRRIHARREQCLNAVGHCIHTRGSRQPSGRPSQCRVADNSSGYQEPACQISFSPLFMMMTAPEETSLPVPAVVGIAISERRADLAGTSQPTVYWKISVSHCKGNSFSEVHRRAATGGNAISQRLCRLRLRDQRQQVGFSGVHQRPLLRSCHPAGWLIR